MNEVLKSSVVVGSILSFNYDGKPRQGAVEKIGPTFLCLNCQLSGGFRNFSFAKMSDAALVPMGWDKV